MTLIRRSIIALALMSGFSPAFAQAPPVPALPDTERRTTYSITGATCACAVNFALYGDSTDYQDWVEVYLNGIRVNYNDATFGWTITSPTGSLATIPRPITDAVLTFNSAQTGTVQIVGARRPRRVSQFSENRGVAARDLNQALTDVIAQNRETWDKINDVTGRSLISQPGNTVGQLPLPSVCAGNILGFDATGLNPVCLPTSTSSLTLPSIPTGRILANISGTTQAPSAQQPTSIWDSVCSSTIGQFWVRQTGGWGCTSLGYANPVWWGADPTGTSDSTSAFNSALAANSNVQFPKGKFKFLSAITYSIPSGNNSVTIHGAGQDNTILFWPNSAGGITITYAGIGSAAHVGDLSFTTGVATGGTALTLSLATSLVNPANTANSDVYRVTMRGDDGYELTDNWTTGISISNVSNVQIDSFMITGPSVSNGTGISLVGLPASSTYGVVYNITKSTFNNTGIGIEYGSFIQGVTVSQTNFTGGGSFGIHASASATGVLAQLAVTNCQFGNILFAIFTGVPVVGMQVLDSSFITPASGAAINAPANEYYQIIGNGFSGSTISSNTGIVMGPSTGGSGGVIVGNVFLGLNDGIFLSDPAAGPFAIQGNRLQNNANNLVNSSTQANQIEGNSGINPVGTQGVATMGASPFTVTAGNSPETHYINQSATLTASCTKGGQSVLAMRESSTRYVIELGPNESYTCTWATTAPIYVRDIH